MDGTIVPVGSRDWLTEWSRFARVHAEVEPDEARAALVDTNADGRELWIGLDVRGPSQAWPMVLDWDDVESDHPVDECPLLILIWPSAGAPDSCKSARLWTAARPETHACQRRPRRMVDRRRQRRNRSDKARDSFQPLTVHHRDVVTAGEALERLPRLSSKPAAINACQKLGQVLTSVRLPWVPDTRRGHRGSRQGNDRILTALSRCQLGTWSGEVPGGRRGGD